MMAGSPETMLHTGEQVTIGGLFIQFIFFGFFMITSFTFHMRIRRDPTSASLTHQAPVSWQKLLLVLYAASGLIMVGSIFRLIEYMQGNDGYLLKHEAYLYVFDAVLMAAAVILFNVYHPSKVLVEQRGRKGFYNNNNSTETYVMAQGA
ncbi:rta1 domain [Moniliophthora roreri MCA 2997]|nr:rta1 domain [Moniliophthora roreri MCA 2997]